MIMGSKKQAGGIDQIDADRRALVRGAGYLTGALAAAAAGAFLLVASPAKSADLASNQITIGGAEASVTLTDPVHKAGLEASANHKVVFVLGEGYGVLATATLKSFLTENLALAEGKDFVVLENAKTTPKLVRVYFDGKVVMDANTGKPLEFDRKRDVSALAEVGKFLNTQKPKVAAADHLTLE